MEKAGRERRIKKGQKTTKRQKRRKTIEHQQERKREITIDLGVPVTSLDDRSHGKARTEENLSSISRKHLLTLNPPLVYITFTQRWSTIKVLTHLQHINPDSITSTSRL